LVLLNGLQWIEESEMAKFFGWSASATAAVLACAAIAAPVSANEPPTSESAYIPTAANEILFGNAPTFNVKRSIGGELNFMFGTSGFPENNITDDAYAIHDAYNYLMYEQTQLDPTIRVPDLVNPFNTSVLLLPSSSSAGMVSGSEFIFE
jgi:hypothetical protein